MRSGNEHSKVNPSANFSEGRLQFGGRNIFTFPPLCPLPLTKGGAFTLRQAEGKGVKRSDCRERSSQSLCQHKKGLPRRTTLIIILVLLDISFSNNSQIAGNPTTPSCTIYQKEKRQNFQNSQIVSTTPAKQNFPKRATLLPDNYALLLWQEHRAVGNTKRLVEGVNIAEGDVYAVAAE